jgi:hypothetical protein
MIGDPRPNSRVIPAIRVFGNHGPDVAEKLCRNRDPVRSNDLELFTTDKLNDAPLRIAKT